MEESSNKTTLAAHMISTINTNSAQKTTGINVQTPRSMHLLGDELLLFCKPTNHVVLGNSRFPPNHVKPI
ncbi:hypothetical protein LINPERHAP1_LOCUS38811, partial [Linum perenne]